MEPPMMLAQALRINRAQQPKKRAQITCKLTLTPDEYAGMRRVAHDIDLPFATWLRRLALEEVRQVDSAKNAVSAALRKSGK